jgi:hypothetical protein
MLKPSLLLFIFFFSLSSFAQTVFRGPLASALGGTGLAGLGDVEGVFINPADVALMPDHVVGMYYRDGYLDDGQHRQTMGLGAGDPGPNVLFPGALHYLRLRDTGRSPHAADGELWHLAIGERIFESLALGISGYRLTYRTSGMKQLVQWNGSIGLIWMYNKKYGLAYVLGNVARPGSNVPEGLREDMYQGVGAYAEAFEIANLRFDILRRETHNPDQRLVYMASFESMSGKFLVFRSGYRLDDQKNERFFTAGLGFNGPRLKVDYSVEKNLERTSGALHSVDLRLPF